MRVARALMVKNTLLALCLLGAASAQNVQERIQRVENGLLRATILKGSPAPRMNIADRMKHYKVPGVSVAVINNWTIEWSKGYGLADVASQKPVGTDTLFQAGSISKPVAAVATMLLVEQGKLNLDEDVNRKLKSWKVPENEFTKDKKVTLRRILSHSAGLTVHGFPGYAAGDRVPTAVEVLDGKKPANTPSVRVDLAPGTRFRYSGGGITIMQLLLSDVTGTPFPELLRKTVLDKIGMRESTYEQPLPERYTASAATGYGSNGKAVPGKWHTYPEMAAAGLWTTAADLARFGIEIQKSWQGKSNKVLSQATVHEMLTKQMEPVGLAFFLEGTEGSARFGHNGADDGFQAILLCTRDTGQGAVIMANSDSGIKVGQEILFSIAAEYGWPDYQPRERAAIRPDAKGLQAYVGKYKFSTGALLAVTAMDDHLMGSMDGAPGNQIYPASENNFFALASDVPEVHFTAAK